MADAALAELACASDTLTDEGLGNSQIYLSSRSETRLVDRIEFGIYRCERWQTKREKPRPRWGQVLIAGGGEAWLAGKTNDSALNPSRSKTCFSFHRIHCRWSVGEQ
jgi:hypothetical protein